VSISSYLIRFFSCLKDILILYDEYVCVHTGY